MKSSILQTAARSLLTPFLLLSLLILYRGHNQPGGGFVGGLVAASAFVLYTVAYGKDAAQRRLRLPAASFIGAGLLTAIASAAWPMAYSIPMMTGLWLHVHLPLAGLQHFGTPLLFDLGVYLTVFGVLMTIVFALSEETT
jgi:multicomponent Na+:H+ antiporter subunit B